MTRRRLLVVAAGGVMIGVGAAVSGCGGAAQGPADSAASLRPEPASKIGGASSGPPKPPPAPTASASAAGAARQPLYYMNEGPKVIALTIDDGPNPLYTPQVLRILDAYRVRATFSMVGQNVTSYPEVAREVADAGHLIINHTWDHANITRLTTARLRTEITRATEAIHQATGVQPRMFRAPYGAWSKEALKLCESQHLTPLDWSVDPRDWSQPGVSEIVATIMRTTRTGSIILEHDGGGNRAQTVAALKIVIPRLLDDGFHFAVPQ